MDERTADGPIASPAPPGPNPAATVVAPAGKPAQPAQPSGESSVRETIESILVAFILAFIFRAFIVEAFVIPTGSMAPTLLGAHIRFDCDDCGYRFDANYRAANTPDGKDVIIPAKAGPNGPYKRIEKRKHKVIEKVVENGVVKPVERIIERDEVVWYWVDKVYRAICPNCGFVVPPSKATNPPVNYGDRILVLKYLYLFQDPERWDVVVFKSPADPETFKYEQNYIKRLVGKPGESVLILDGDVYTTDPGEDDSLISNYEVRAKPRHVQEVLWRVIYDNDHHPRGLERPDGGRWRQPWTPAGSGWKLDVDGGRTFRFDSADARGTLAFDPTANPETLSFTDWLAYDLEEKIEPVPVNDLKLDLYYQRTSGDGPLRLRLARGDDAFIAEITPTDAKLLRAGGSAQPQQLGATPLPKGLNGRPVRVEFEHVDYRVTLLVDGKTLLETTPAQYAPDPVRLLKRTLRGSLTANEYARLAEGLKEAYVKQVDGSYHLSMDERRQRPPQPSVQIEAERQTADLRHVSLWRDIYYTNKRNPEQSSPIWATPVNFPEGVARLGAEEYFVLGDNSLVSGDARYWNDDINLPDEALFVESGRVPGRFMLGKAFFVYWPAGYRPAEFMPALTPNFGDMRFIR